jgi:predicted nucleic acid-binding Zn ribbon protein
VENKQMSEIFHQTFCLQCGKETANKFCSETCKAKNIYAKRFKRYADFQRDRLPIDSLGRFDNQDDILGKI